MNLFTRDVPLHQYLLLLLGMYCFVSGQWISDDGFIYLTYVESLVRGEGLVFNRLESVEGFTSVLWVLLLSAGRWMTRAAGEWLTLRHLTFLISHGLSLTSLALAIVVNRRVLLRYAQLAPHERRMYSVNLPLIFIVGTSAIQQFSTSGLETPLVILFCTLVSLQILTPPNSPLLVTSLAAAGPMVRPDLAILSFALIAHAWFHGGRKRAWRIAAIAVIANLFIVATRVWYYAAFLPNTYYAKTGIDQPLVHGMHYLRDLTLSYGTQWILILAVLGSILKFRVSGLREELYARLWLLGGSLAFAAYVVAVGGDFMHGRFWLPTLLLLYFAFSGLDAPALKSATSGASPARVSAARWAFVVLATAVVLYGIPVEDAMDENEDAQFHGISNQRKAYFLTNRNLHRWSEENLHEWAVLGRRLANVSRALDEEIGVAAGGIGQIAFYGMESNSRLYIFDLFGLTQPVVTRLDMGDVSRRIGHKKLAPAVYTALHDRIDFGGLYVEGYNQVFRLAPPNDDLILVNLSMIPKLTQKGLVEPEFEARVDTFIRNHLVREEVDANFLYFLSRRYVGRAEIEALIQDAYSRSRGKSEWERWWDRNGSQIRALDEQIGNERNLLQNLRIAFRNLALPPIDYLGPKADLRELATSPAP